MIRRFLDWLQYERRYSMRTVSEYGDDLRAFATFMGNDEEQFDPAEVATYDVKTWMVDMLDHQLSPRTVKRRLSALRSFYKYLLRQGLVKRDVTQGIIAPKTDKPLPVFFRESEMQKEEAIGERELDELMHQPDGGASPKEIFELTRDNLIISMLYQTGMRRAEIIGLQDSDIDLHQGQIRVFGKRRKERVVPIGERLVGEIEAYMDVRQGFESPDHHLLTSVRRDGSMAPMNAKSVYEMVRKRMGEVSTLKKHSPHVLRHTFATTMLNNGADIRTIQTLLGHASLSATQVYTHTTFEQIQQAYKHAHPRSQKPKNGEK
ncbi:MAG: tyrosine-type recombinase/integrase [Paludibacteraceae bacterium]|nr:tyrosine-type recombinase/integrase [Paludibacteraceae bacterium]